MNLESLYRDCVIPPVTLVLAYECPLYRLLWGVWHMAGRDGRMGSVIRQVDPVTELVYVVDDLETAVYKP